jgi:HAD superfamily hydrolase (TIGR01484 family)
MIENDMAPPAALPRLIATDLDGTLLRSDGSLSARTQGALARATAAGMEIMLVTGRPARHVRQIAGVAAAGGVVICVNGALIYDLAGDAVLRETRIPAAVARELVLGLRAHLPGIGFAVEVGLDYGWDPGYGRHRGKIEAARLPVADAVALCARGVNKLIAHHPDLPPEDFIARSRDVIAGRAAATYSGAPFLEVGALGVDKASALTAYCAERAIDRRDVLAFGDMPNDLTMLEWAGRGVAMANAHATVLAAVAEVTRSNDDDGVALVLERLIAGESW